VNLRQNFYTRDLIADSLALANAVKLNDDELRVLAPTFGLRGVPREQLAQLARKFDLRLVALTRGGNGSVLIAGEKFSENSGVQTKVADTIGAGDSFTAAMTIGFLAGWPLDGINARAAEIAAFVCSQSGATPPLPDALSQVFRTACLSR
jgi:fructokinase